MNSVTKIYKLPTGGTVKITLSQHEPIDEAELERKALNLAKLWLNFRDDLKANPTIQ